MKKLLLIFSALFIICAKNQTVLGQSEKSYVGLYSWNEVVFLHPYNHESKDSITSIIGQKFRVLKIKDGSAIIQILNYKDSTSNFFNYNFGGKPAEFKALPPEKRESKSYSSNQRYFIIDTNYIDSYATKDVLIRSSISIGAINFPFKYRPQKKYQDFSGSFNFGVALGVNFEHKSWRRYTHSILTSYSISNVVLDSISITSNYSKLSSTNNFTAFSFAVGYLIQHEKIQAGVFIGCDRINRINQQQFGWKYQGKPWLSVAFGIAIFSPQNEKKTDNETEQPKNH